MPPNPAIRKDKLVAVTYEHCGLCGWHYHFYALMEGNTKIRVDEAGWDDVWGEYGTSAAYENGDRFLAGRAAELLNELGEPSA